MKLNKYHKLFSVRIKNVTKFKCFYCKNKIQQCITDNFIIKLITSFSLGNNFYRMVLDYN